MAKPKNVLLLYGGKSQEHEISLISAASILARLDSNKYNILPVGIDQEGLLYQNDYYELLTFTDSLPVVTKKSCKIPSLLHNGKLAIDADVVFPVTHGPLYEDGCLQGLLELAGVAYVGCKVLASAIGMDKDLARRICGNDEIPTARYLRLSSYATTIYRQQFCQQVALQFGWPLFVKPCAAGSSVGVHKVKNLTELNSAIADAFRYDHNILVEEFIQGTEIELAVLENAQSPLSPKVSIPGEIIIHHEDGFYSYAAKYLQSEKTSLQIPAKLSEGLVQRLQNMAAKIFISLRCTGMARIDFFVNKAEKTIYFNEINSIPGFTSISMYPRLWQASGLGYTELLNELIDLALHSYCHRQQLVTKYQ